MNHFFANYFDIISIDEIISQDKKNSYFFYYRSEKKSDYRGVQLIVGAHHVGRAPPLCRKARA